MTNTTIERIKKLLALSASPNPHEAAQAAAMAADLMERHGVESADLQGDDVSPVSSQEADHEEPWYRTLTGCARTRDVASMKLVTSAPPNVTELIEAAHRVVDCFSDTEPLVLAAPGIEAEKAILQLRRILETKE